MIFAVEPAQTADTGIAGKEKSTIYCYPFGVNSAGGFAAGSSSKSEPESNYGRPLDSEDWQRSVVIFEITGDDVVKFGVRFHVEGDITIDDIAVRLVSSNKWLTK